MHAQILQKEIKAGTNVVTDPLKATQNASKEVVDPIKDARKGINDVTKAPKEVAREIDKTEKSIDNIGKEVDRTKSDVDKLTGKGGDDKNKNQDQDSTAKKGVAADGKGETNGGKTTNGGKYVPPDYVPEKNSNTVATSTMPSGASNDVPRPVPPGSRDNKTPSGPMPVVPDTKVAGGPDPGMNPDQIRASQEASAENSGRYVELSSNGSNGERRTRPDYSNSPARLALEKADFDVETLEQLFKYSDWAGPEREHTVRAVEYSLNELQQSIIEIKKLDPGFSTWRFEERYKEMRAAFQKAKQS